MAVRISDSGILVVEKTAKEKDKRLRFTALQLFVKRGDGE